MSSSQDPFYIVKQEIQDSIDKLLSTFHQWEQMPANIATTQRNELLTGCETILWQVDELGKTIDVAATAPSRYKIDEVELDKRRRWTTNARNQVSNVKKSVVTANSDVNGIRRELMRSPDLHQTDKYNMYSSQDSGDFVSSESDRQVLLIRQHDEELDELSASVERLGSVGLSIHDELLFQEKFIDDLGNDMDSSLTRLKFAQKKLGMVMKKAGAKGQLMMILFLLALFIILFVLVFLT